MRRTLALTLVALAFSTASAFAGTEARMSGTVLDAATQQPIADAVITLDATEKKKLQQKATTKADGKFAVFVLDGTIRYKFTVSAPGYTPYEEVIKMDLGGTTQRDFTLTKASGAVLGGGQKADPAADAYNEGAVLANSGDTAAAIAKFQEALTLNPDLTAGWIALAKTALKAKEYPRAIEAAQKALEVDDDQPDMYEVLFHAYTATGDKANAAKAEAKMPKNAASLFNEAARMINSSNDAGAEQLLQQAVAMDGGFAQAWYELGMIYVRGGKNAEAKAALTKYLELDPNGKDAATAKEMLTYVK